MRNNALKLTLLRNLSGGLLLALAGASASGQAPVIASLGADGLLVCTNLQPGTTSSVEWASSVLGPWTNSWAALNAVTVDSNGVLRVSVPRFYRVRGLGWTNGTVSPFTPPSNMVWIAAGAFTMGSPTNEPARTAEEGPQTPVTISRGFCMSKHEVTQGEYVAVKGSNPSYFTGDPNRPVEQVSWNDAVAYCAALTVRERNAGRLPAGYVYRLPTEAEWEFACRAGTTAAFHYGEALSSGRANFDGHYEYPPCEGSTNYCYNVNGTYLGRTTAVGSYAPNAWGLSDLHGNVWEWCQDWSGPYPGASVSDPQGPVEGSFRVIRGGGWNQDAGYCRSASRDGGFPTRRSNMIGFRVVLAPGP